MSKVGFFFYTGDWLKDTKHLRPATKGHYIDLLCAMNEAPVQGELKWPFYAFCAEFGISTKQTYDILTELLDSGTLDGEIGQESDEDCPDNCSTNHLDPATGHNFMRNCNALVTLINRRMKREYNARVTTNQRVRKHREKTKERAARHRGANGECNAPVMPCNSASSYSSSYSSSSSYKNKTQTVAAFGGVSDLTFRKFWSLYPNHEGSETEAWQEWQKEAHHAIDTQEAIFAYLAANKNRTYPRAEKWLEAKSWHGRGLDPRIKTAADKIYLSDRKKFDRLIGWIKQAQQQKYRDEVIAMALTQFQRYAKTTEDWWPYLDKIINRVEKDMNAAVSRAEHEEHKREEREYCAEAQLRG